MYDDNPEDIDRRALMAQMKAGGVATPRAGKIEAPGMTPEAAPAATPAAPAAAAPSAFHSDNASVSGYLQDAARAFAPKVRAIADEAGRKSAVQEYLNSLAPEIQKRGGSISDIKGEKARVDGRLIDFYRDIEGAADPQYLDVTDQGPGAAPVGMAMGGPSAFQGIQALMPTDTNYYNTLQDKLKAILGGDQAFDRNALIAQMSR